MKEEWRDIPGYEGRYKVSSRGRIKSVRRTVERNGRVIAARVMSVSYVLSRGAVDNPYPVVWLRRPGEHRKFFVHRLVADAFIPNPEGHPMVNHKDGNKQNPHVLNLEWCSFKENTQHYYRQLKPAISASVEEVEIDPSDIPF